MFSQTILVGRLSRDADMKFSANGKASLTLSIPVNRNRKVGDEWKQDTTWYTVIAWGDSAERNASLQKGALVAINGHMEQQKWEGDNGEKHERWVLIADRITRLDRKGGRDE
jgi:single-strand DNA-binding protein